MNRTAEAFLEQAEEYVRLADAPARLASDRALLDRLSAVVKLRRLAQAEETALAGEIARRAGVAGRTSGRAMVVNTAAVGGPDRAETTRRTDPVREQGGVSAPSGEVSTTSSES